MASSDVQRVERQHAEARPAAAPRGTVKAIAPKRHVRGQCGPRGGRQRDET